MLEDRYDIRRVQALLGHRDLRRTIPMSSTEGGVASEVRRIAFPCPPYRHVLLSRWTLAR
jgi:hypothetical protein